MMTLKVKIQMLEQGDRDSTNSHRKTGGKPRLMYVSTHNKTVWPAPPVVINFGRRWILHHSVPMTLHPQKSVLGSPFSYFSTLFSDEMVNYISEQTDKSKEDPRVSSHTALHGSLSFPIFGWLLGFTQQIWPDCRHHEQTEIYSFCWQQ